MNEVVKFIEDHKTLVICRGIYGDDLLHLITALHAEWNYDGRSNI